MGDLVLTNLHRPVVMATATGLVLQYAPSPLPLGNHDSSIYLLLSRCPSCKRHKPASQTVL